MENENTIILLVIEGEHLQCPMCNPIGYFMIKFMHFIQWNIWIELNWIELNWKYNSSFIYQMQCTSKISIPIYGWYYKKYLMVITMISVKKNIATTDLTVSPEKKL